MVNEIKKLEGDDFEVIPTDAWKRTDFEDGVKQGPYVFARDREIERKIDEQRRKDEESGRTEGQSKQGSRERNNHVPFREW